MPQGIALTRCAFFAGLFKPCVDPASQSPDRSPGASCFRKRLMASAHLSTIMSDGGRSHVASLELPRRIGMLLIWKPQTAGLQGQKGFQQKAPVRADPASLQELAHQERAEKSPNLWFCPCSAFTSNQRFHEAKHVNLYCGGFPWTFLRMAT